MEIITALISAGITVAAAHRDKIINFFKNRFTKKTLEDEIIPILREANPQITVEDIIKILQEKYKNKFTIEGEEWKIEGEEWKMGSTNASITGKNASITGKNASIKMD